jgi:hypothetical protein
MNLSLDEVLYINFCELHGDFQRLSHWGQTVQEELNKITGCPATITYTVKGTFYAEVKVPLYGHMAFLLF